MEKLLDGYYFMFEIGWFLDLLIPTLVRIKDGSLYFIGSKPCEARDIKPCCIPCGGAEEVKKLSFDDPSLKAFRSLDSLIIIQNREDLEGELQGTLENQKIRDRYLNTKAKIQREATVERITNDYNVLSIL